MATHPKFKNLTAVDLEEHLSALTTLASTTREAVNSLVEFERRLTRTLQDTIAAHKLLGIGANQLTGRVNVRLGSGKELLSIADLARELGVSRQTIFTMRMDGRLPEPVQISRRKVGFRRSQIAQWIENGGSL